MPLKDPLYPPANHLSVPPPGRYDEAIKHYTDALKADPENNTFCAVIYSNRSACHAGKKDWQAAFDDASESLKKDHTFLKVHAHTYTHTYTYMHTHAHMCTPVDTVTLTHPLHPS
jgi:tetratricopeptide (TPR) repeat protein